MFDNILKKIKGLGLDEQKSQELFEELSKEVLDIIFKELAAISTEEELQVYQNRIQDAKSTEHFETIIAEIATKVYGDNSEFEIENIFDSLITELDSIIKQAKNLVQNSQKPENKELLSRAEQTQIYKDIVNNNE